MAVQGQKKKTMDMTEGPILKELALFSLPLLAGNIFQQLYNTVDSIVVGNFVGPDALGAVTTNAAPINTLIGLFVGMSTGASVIISQYFGAKDRKMLRRSIHTSIVMTFWMGIAIMFLGYFITPPIVRFMNTPESIVPLSETYLRIYFAGVLGLMFYNIGSAILRAVGDSMHPLYFLILSSVTNVVLDLVFVIAFHMGVAGVAYATIISQFVSAAATFFILFRSKDVYSISMKEMHMDRALLGKIFRVGFPAGLQMAVTSFSNVFVQGYINAFGAASTAGWGTYGRIDAFVMLPMQSLGLAITTFVGQNAGAGKLERIKKGVNVSLVLSILVTLALCIPLVIFAPFMVSLFNRDAQVIYYGTLFIRLNSVFDAIACTNQIHAGALRGIGDAKTPMIIMLGSFVVFRQIYLFIASHLTDSVYPIAVAYPIGWLLCSVIMFLYFRRINWKKELGIIHEEEQEEVRENTQQNQEN